MTIAERRSATELGLRPAPPNPPPASKRLRAAGPLLFFFMGLAIGLARLDGPKEDLYPVAGDSAKYHKIAQGFAEIYRHPLETARLLLTRSATAADLERTGFDSWVLQHAPAYTATLGLGYLLPLDDVATGRFLTIAFFGLAAALAFLLGRALCGSACGALAGTLVLLWPAHWTYAPAILTEIPVAAAGLGTAYLLLHTGGALRRRGWLAGGIVLGLLVLTKTTLRFLAIPLLALELLVDRRVARPERLRRFAWRLGGWGSVQAVWLLFLWCLHLPPNPLAKTGDDWLWIYRGNYVPDRGWETVGLGDVATPELLHGLDRAETAPPERRRSTIYREAFLETVRRDPGGWVALVISKAGMFWGLPAVKTYESAGPLSLPPPIRLQPALALLGLLGLALCLGKGSHRCLPAAIPIYLTLLHAGTHFVGRYNIPAVPFAHVYAALAACGLAEAVRSRLSPPDRRIRLPRLRPLAAPAGAFLAGVVLALALARWGGPARFLAPVVWAAGSVPALRATLGGPARGWLRTGVVCVPLAFVGAGTIASDADPDLGRVRLREPGDGVRLGLELPPGTAEEGFVAAELLLDLLPSARGTLTISARISGKEVARFENRPPSRSENFLLDPEVHAQEDRYRRILRSVDRHLQGFVRKEPGLGSAGYDYYRQWHRITIDPSLLSKESPLELELVVLESKDATLDLYIDRDAPAAGSPARTIRMPALIVNAYEVSSYRFDALASDREMADARLIRPVPIYSRRIGSERFDRSGQTRPLRGEPRMRLRVRVPGELGLARDGRGRLAPVFAADPRRLERFLEPQEIRQLQADRDRFVDGWVVF